MAQFVKSEERVLEALGLENTPKGRKRIALYRSGKPPWTDFPKKTQRGYSLDDLDAFTRRHAGDISAENALDDLKRGKSLGVGALKLIESTAENPASRGQRSDVSANETGSLFRAEGAVAALLRDANTQKQMAVNLQQCYRARLRRDVTEVDVCKWLKNTDLPEGAPLPPPKINGVLKGDEWAPWFEKWILPLWMGDPQSQQDLINLTALERENKIESLQHEKFLRDLDRGKYIEKSVAKNTAIGAVKLQDGIVKRLNEVVFAKKLIEQLALRPQGDGGPRLYTTEEITEAALAAGKAVQDEIAANYKRVVKELSEQRDVAPR